MTEQVTDRQVGGSRCRILHGSMSEGADGWQEEIVAEGGLDATGYCQF